MITSIQALDLSNVDPDNSIIIISFDKNTALSDRRYIIDLVKDNLPNHKIIGVASDAPPLIQIINDKDAANKITDEVNDFIFNDAHHIADPIDRNFLDSLENKDDLTQFHEMEPTPIPIGEADTYNLDYNDETGKQMLDQIRDRHRIRSSETREKIERVRRQLKLTSLHRLFMTNHPDWDEGSGD